MKITITKTISLFEFLLEQYPHSPKTRIKKLLQSGTIRCCNQVVTHHDFRLKPGDVVEVGSQSGKATRAALPFPVLFEDRHVIVIDKPAGIVTSTTDDIKSVQRLITQSLKKQSHGKISTHVVHRLDKEVSGILLLAKSRAVMETLKNNWRQTQKRYYALVEGKLEKPEGTIKSWLIEEKSQKVHSVSDSKGAKLAVTHYRTIKQVPPYTLLDVSLETGRKNQIRVHLSEMGCPIVGDTRYGASNEYLRRIRLHAYFLHFSHPVSGKIIIIESPMPKGFLSVKKKDERYK